MLIDSYIYDEQLFEFATKHTGVYQNSIPVAGQFYSSSGYEVFVYIYMYNKKLLEMRIKQADSYS